MMNHGPTAICHSSGKGGFITWTLAGHENQFMEISYMQIGLSIADITVA
jgi:hypothetical protein